MRDVIGVVAIPLAEQRFERIEVGRGLVELEVPEHLSREERHFPHLVEPLNRQPLPRQRRFVGRLRVASEVQIDGIFGLAEASWAAGRRGRDDLN
jgi:hypothetical protein